MLNKYIITILLFLYSTSSAWGGTNGIYPTHKTSASQPQGGFGPLLSPDTIRNSYTPDLTHPQMDDRANSQDDRDATLPDLDPKINMSNEVTRKLLNSEHQDIIVVIDDTNIYREFKKTKWEKARKSEKIDMLQKYVKGLSIRKQPLFDKLQSYSASLRRDYKHLPALLLRVKSITDVNNIAQLPFVKAIYENTTVPTLIE